jgi:methyl-accepting chemotaxis protein
MSLSNLKIGARLGLGFAAVLALAVMVGLGAMNRLAKVNEATADMATNWMPALFSLGSYAAAINAERRAEAMITVATEDKIREAEGESLSKARGDADKAWSSYAATITQGEEHDLAKATAQAQVAYRLLAERAMAQARQGDNAGATAIYRGDGRVAFDGLRDALKRLAEFQSQGAQAAYDQSQQDYRHTQWAVMGTLAAVLALGAGLAWGITRSITQPIREAVRVAETVASGDLRARVRNDRNDETGQLLGALARMNDNLLRIVSDVRLASDSIATGSTQIATGNQDLSQRTEEQASNLQQTAASMEQITQTVKHNADAAQQARQLARSATGAAEHSGEVVGQVVSTMDEISQSSRKIADIIGVIDGIAFQTNILALNAAVEAARAGEQGRGFAVVASEVRALAQRSAGAAKEIKSLIHASVDRVQAGTTLVSNAGTAIADVVMQVQRVNDLVGEISAASHEQSQGIGQVGDAVSQLDQVTQQNAALVEESAAAAESLKHQAAHLARTVAVFKVDEAMA